MISMNTYVPVMGLEVHARIRTEHKFFCSCKNEAIPSYPNANICPICTGHPGMLPHPNKEAVALGMKAALALGCTVATFSKFDRKNYFYPDLPMGYQISQYDQPLAENGTITIEKKDGTQKIIGIERLHLENDAGKLSHSHNGSLVDYNRAGAPLMEIVSKPEIRSVEEASLYARELQMIVRACGASEADMEKGMMRFDANISLRKDENAPFGTKVEIKNLNSFKSLEKAIAYEMNRQATMLDNGEIIIQETRGWDDEKEITVSQRTKEGAADYRYFPEPDIPPLTFTLEEIEAVRNTLPELPTAKKERYKKDYNLDTDSISILLADELLAAYFIDICERTKNPKATTSWVLSVLLGELKEHKLALTELPFSSEDFAKIILMVINSEVSQLGAKEVISHMVLHGGDPEKIVEERGLKQVSDTSSLEAIVKEIIEQFPNQTAEYKNGKTSLLGFFVGQSMKKSGGSANPKILGELVQKLLS